MKLWTVRYGEENAHEYDGQIPEFLDLQSFGIDWAIFRALSPIDATRQALRYKEGNHPIGGELNQIGRNIRVLAAENRETALAYFLQNYPAPFPVGISPLPTKMPDKYMLKLEAIGHESQKKIRNMTWLLGEDDYKPNRPWVAEIIGLDPKYKFSRLFIKHNTDYRESSNTGDRGVYFYFELKSGSIYEVNQRVSWKQTNRYFCKIENGQQVIIEDKEPESLHQLQWWQRLHGYVAPCNGRSNEAKSKNRFVVY